MATPGAKLFVALLLACSAAVPARAQFMDYPPLGAQTLFEASRPAQPALPDEVLECMTGPNFPFEQLKGNLALTDDQHQQIYKIECKYLAQIDPLLAQLKASARQLNALMTAPQL